jgi:hypothetical protein
MPLGLSVALAIAAQPASGGAAPAAARSNQPSAAAPADSCKRSWPNLETGEIVVCAERPQGYRINADIMKAQKMKRVAGRPSRAAAAGVKDTSACAVGPHPMGCQSAGINIIGAALTAVEMASRLARGEEIGSMFVTNPEPDEYQLYVAAKAAREAEEAAKAAKAKTAPKSGAEAVTGAAAPSTQHPDLAVPHRARPTPRPAL